jgi:HEAT repeat protein
MTDSPCPEVDELLASRRMRRRLEGVERLAELIPAAAIPRLERSLFDSRLNIQVRAADLLRARFGEEGRTVLLRALQDDREWVHLPAACSFAQERDPRALEVLESVLRSPDVDQWGPAVAALELFGAAARSIIERELTDEQEGPPFLREMVASSLATVAGEEARPALEVAAGSTNKNVRSAAQRALARLDAELASH